MFILSFDFGTKNIGVAIGQNITYTANTLDVIKVKNNISYWDKISNIINVWKPKLIIVGYPLNMDGTEQNFTKKVKIFSQKLYNKYSICVKLHDERLSTIEARSILYKNFGYRKINNNHIHSLSAVLILESWFNQNKIY